MKATVVLVTLAAVLFGFVVLVEKPIREARLRESTRKVFPSFNPADVRRVQIRTAGGDDIQIALTND